jgi:hypothetical protein
MLRAVVGVCLFVAFCATLARPVDASPSPLKSDPLIARSSHVFHAPDLAIEAESESQDRQIASEPFCLMCPDARSENHLSVRRKDRNGAHFPMLLTCGRLLIESVRRPATPSKAAIRFTLSPSHSPVIGE